MLSQNANVEVVIDGQLRRQLFQIPNYCMFNDPNVETELVRSLT